MEEKGRKFKKITVKIIRILGWTVLVIFGVLLLVALAIQIPAVQNAIVGRVVTFAEEKFGTPVSLDHISISFPKRIVIRGLYVEDQQQDTLLYAGSISVDADMMALLSRRIRLNEVVLEQVSANVARSAEGVFNFDFIVDSFSTEEVSQEPTGPAWDFAIHGIRLEAIRARFDDRLEGNDVSLNLKSLLIGTDKFDLSGRVIDVDRIALTGITTGFRHYSPPSQTAEPVTPDEAPAEPGFVIRVRTLDLQDIFARYTDDVGGSDISLDLGALRAADQTVDMEHRAVEGKSLYVGETFLAYHQMTADTVAVAVTSPDTTGSPEPGWRFALDQLTFEDNSLQYYDLTSPRHAGFDPDHLWVTNLQADIRGIFVGDEQYRARVNKFSFHESAGFQLRSMTAGIGVDSAKAAIDDLTLRTRNSLIRLNLTLVYPSLASLSRDIRQASISAAVTESHIGMADVNLLTPGLLPAMPLHLPDSGRVYVDAEAGGLIDEMTFRRLNISALSGTALSARGEVRNITSPEALWFRVDLDEFRTTSRDVSVLLPDSLLPGSMALPEWVTVSGDFSGTPLKPDMRLDMRSDLGDVYVDALVDLDSATDRAYEGHVRINQFDLGKLIGQEGMGVLDLEGSIEGRGMTMEDIDAYATVNINEFEFNDYVYRNLSVDGELDRHIFRGSAAMDDPNLKFDLKGDLDYGYAGVKKQYHFDLDLRQADLQSLNFLNRPLEVSLRLSVDLDDADPANLNGGLSIHDAAFNNGEEIFRMDSLLVASINQEGRSSLNIDSDFIHGAFTGTFQLLSLPSVLKRHFSAYYALDVDSAGTMDHQQFEFDLEIRNTSFLTEVLMPDLERIDPGEIRGAFDSDENRLDLSVAINELVHSSLEARNINLDVTSDRRELEYEFTASDILAGPLTIPEVAFDGRVAGDSIETGIVVYDSAQEERYVIRGIFRSLNDAYRFSLLPDYVILNYNSWTVPRDNAVLVAAGGFAAENLDLGFEDQKISIRAPVGQDSTLNVGLERLDLQGLMNIAFSDTLVSGKLSGTINVHGSKERGPLEAAIDIRDLGVRGQVMGDLNITVDQPVPGQTVFQLRGEGPGLDMDVGGTYDARPGVAPNIQLRAGIRSLNLEAVQPFVANQATGLKGNLECSLSVHGPPGLPEIDGSITFRNAEVIPAYTGSVLKLNNETVTFRGSDIILRNFTLRDHLDNTLVLDGRVLADEPYTLNLTAKARNFQLLNTGQGDNDLFYGQLWLNTTSQVRGTLDHPEIDMTVGLGEKSNFTFVVPQSEAGVMASEGIVAFVDRDKPDDRTTGEQSDSPSARAPFQGITLTSRIELNGTETFTIVLDPLTEDKLVVNGEATLTLDIDATGNMNLTGRYELTKGTYDFTFYKLVKRNFAIEPGSTIVWNGEPLNAELGITARYSVEASPIDLLSSQVPQGTDLDQYRPRLPFLVFLNIRGDLLRPEISFSLDMPEQQQGAMGGAVYAKIQDINTRESDLNKQVFALLILQRFVADNPFESQSGGTVKSAARTSVNRMLSDQLNRMAENLEGVELTFDLQSFEEYQDGGMSERTQLQLGVSKRLLDDRLVVKLSGNVDIEGGQGQQRNLTDYIGDLALEYKLTEDGRFRINGFYNSDYDMIDGELKEAGVGLIYIKDYDSLRELFKPNDQNKK